ncbi:MAG: hypothetical protein II888_03680 [Clostridia bacterium]|nr:hypothetical protein [Clostridia bacterium]
MKYHIDTIPVWDAQKLDGECLLCALERKTELGEAERYLGASVMEPDVRIQVNDRGFCRKHHAMLFGMSNRLGHALMLESHMIENRERLEKSWSALEKAGEQLSATTLGDRLNGKMKAAKETVVQEARKIQEMSGTCLMCDTIRENMRRYLHTFFHLYQHDGEFKRKFLEGKGLCIPHLGQLMEAAAEELGAKELGQFVRELAVCEKRNLDRMQEDISWFIKKFDYRFDKEDWKNSRDAVERTVNKTRGWCVGKEPNEG